MAMFSRNSPLNTEFSLHISKQLFQYIYIRTFLNAEISMTGKEISPMTTEVPFCLRYVIFFIWLMYCHKFIKLLDHSLKKTHLFVVFSKGSLSELTAFITCENDCNVSFNPCHPEPTLRKKLWINLSKYFKIIGSHDFFNEPRWNWHFQRIMIIFNILAFNKWFLGEKNNRL